MNTRERFKACMNFQPFDRLPMVEWASWWNKTIERWHSEGLPESCKTQFEIFDHFGLDVYKQDWLRPRHWDCPSPESHGAGIIKDEADYDNIHEHLFNWPIDKDKWEQWAKEQEEGSAVLWFTVEGYFWFPRTLFGIEQHLFAFYDQADLMHRMNRELAEWTVKMIEELCEICTPDFMTFAEDMSYNHGPMLSEELFDEFMLPYYNIVIPELDKRGIISVIDSDGDITVPAHWFERAGIQGILPLERQAGVDISVLRQDHPQMRFIGQFDKMTMNQGEDRMREEFERLTPTAGKGGYLISCDHQTPPGVSYDDYQIYLKLFREYGERAGRISRGEDT